jgi:predicted HD superfamily hydrolase involved in NAD metabolism
MGVEGLALTLAQQHGVDPAKSLLAALLHDYSKAEPKDRLESLMAQGTDHRASDEDRQHPAMWHGIAAATVGRTEFSVSDSQVLEAIAFHTTGTPGMSAVGLVLYVADFLEPTRSFNGVDELRKRILPMKLREAALTVARLKIERIQRKNQPLHGRTVQMAEWLARETGN